MRRWIAKPPQRLVPGTWYLANASRRPVGLSEKHARAMLAQRRHHTGHQPWRAWASMRRAICSFTLFYLRPLMRRAIYLYMADSVPAFIHAT